MKKLGIMLMLVAAMAMSAVSICYAESEEKVLEVPPYDREPIVFSGELTEENGREMVHEFTGEESGGIHNLKITEMTQPLQITITYDGNEALFTEVNKVGEEFSFYAYDNARITVKSFKDASYEIQVMMPKKMWM